jgi:hypothetical protein
MGKGFDSS